MLSVDDLERVLRRKPINRGQITLLKLLYESDDQFVARNRIVDEIRWGDDASFTGVLAAFAGRINHTRGFRDDKPGYDAFIERRTIGGKQHLRLRPEARRAVERVSSLLEVFERPMDELLEGVKITPSPRSLRETYADSETLPPKWDPTSYEDRLIAAYFDQVGGTFVTEVQTGASGPGRWPRDSGRRRIDAVRFLDEGRDEICNPSAFTQKQLCKIFRDRHVEVIECKKTLNRPVIGQAIAGRDLFERDYAPRTIEPVVLCGKNDPALAWVCRKNGIRVEIIEPG